MTEKQLSLEEQGITQEDINEALHDFARYGEVDNLQELCDSTDTGPFVQYNCLDQSKSTALHKAAANGHFDAIKYLCGKGSEYILNENDVGPITWAIMNAHVEAVKYLIEQFSDQIDMLLMPNNGGKSPVAVAYDSGNAEIVSMVLMHPSAQKLESLYPNVGLNEGDEEMGEDTPLDAETVEEEVEERRIGLADYEDSTEATTEDAEVDEVKKDLEETAL